MSWVDKIKYYYENGLWIKEWVRNVTAKGAITEEEYEEIIGEKYREYIP